MPVRNLLPLQLPWDAGSCCNWQAHADQLWTAGDGKPPRRGRLAKKKVRVTGLMPRLMLGGRRLSCRWLGSFVMKKAAVVLSTRSTVLAVD